MPMGRIPYLEVDHTQIKENIYVFDAFTSLSKKTEEPHRVRAPAGC